MFRQHISHFTNNCTHTQTHHLNEDTSQRVKVLHKADSNHYKLIMNHHVHRELISEIKNTQTHTQIQISCKMSAGKKPSFRPVLTFKYPFTSSPFFTTIYTQHNTKQEKSHSISRQTNTNPARFTCVRACVCACHLVFLQRYLAHFSVSDEGSRDLVHTLSRAHTDDVVGRHEAGFVTDLPLKYRFNQRSMNYS